MNPIYPISTTIVRVDENNPFVLYITEHLIKKTTKEDVLKNILSLNLQYKKETNEKIRFIENLTLTPNLLELNISNHQISKIDGLFKLTQLREIDLSGNKISKIEGLETLQVLEVLNLSNNLIDKVPKVIKKNKLLRVLRLTGNKLNNLQDIENLRENNQLSAVSFQNNPLSLLPHYSEYVIYSLPTLDILDGENVSIEKRLASNQRFSREEEERLRLELDQSRQSAHDFEESLKITKDLLRNTQIKLDKKEEEIEILANENKQLREELKVKTQLFNKKSKELSSTTQRFYELQQEMAFAKIDNFMLERNAITNKDQLIIEGSKSQIEKEFKKISDVLVSLQVERDELTSKIDISTEEQRKSKIRAAKTRTHILDLEKQVSLILESISSREIDSNENKRLILAEGLRQVDRLNEVIVTVEQILQNKLCKINETPVRYSQEMEEDLELIKHQYNELSEEMATSLKLCKEIEFELEGRSKNNKNTQNQNSEEINTLKSKLRYCTSTLLDLGREYQECEKNVSKIEHSLSSNITRSNDLLLQITKLQDEMKILLDEIKQQQQQQQQPFESPQLIPVFHSNIETTPQKDFPDSTATTPNTPLYFQALSNVTSSQVQTTLSIFDIQQIENEVDHLSKENQELKSDLKKVCDSIKLTKSQKIKTPKSPKSPQLSPDLTVPKKSSNLVSQDSLELKDSQKQLELEINHLSLSPSQNRTWKEQVKILTETILSQKKQLEALENQLGFEQARIEVGLEVLSKSQSQEDEKTNPENYQENTLEEDSLLISQLSTQSLLQSKLLANEVENLEKITLQKRQEITEIEQELVETQHKVSLEVTKMEHEMKELDLKHERKLEQIQDLGAQIGQAVNELNVVAVDLRERKAELETLQHEIDIQTSALKANQNQEVEMKRIESLIDVKKEEMDRIDNLLSQRKSDLEVLAREVQEKHLDLNYLNDELVQQNNKLEKTVSEIRTQNEHLDKANQTHIEKQESITELEKEIEEKKISIEDSEFVLDSTQRELTKVSEMLSFVKSEYEAIQTGFNQKKSESEALKIEFEKKNREMEDLNKKIKNLETKSSEVESEFFDNKSKIEEIKKEMLDELNQLKVELSDVKQQLEAKKGELSSKNQECEDIENKIRELAKEYQNVYNEIGELRELFQNETDYLQRAKLENNKVNDDIRRVSEQLSSLRKECVEKEKEKKEIHLELEKTKMDIEVLQSYLTELREEHDAAKETSQSNRNRIENANSEYFEIANKVKKEKEAFNLLRKEKRELEEKIKMLNVELSVKDSREVKKTLLQQVEHLKNELLITREQLQIEKSRKDLELDEEDETTNKLDTRLERFQQFEIERMKEKIEKIQQEKQVDVKGIQRIYALKEANLQSKILILEKELTQIPYENHNIIRHDIKTLIMNIQNFGQMRENMKTDEHAKEIKEVFARLLKEVRAVIKKMEGIQLAVHEEKKEIMDKTELSHIIEERDTQVEFLINQLKAQQTRLSDLEKTSAEYQKLIFRLYKQKKLNFESNQSDQAGHSPFQQTSGSTKILQENIKILRAENKDLRSQCELLSKQLSPYSPSKLS